MDRENQVETELLDTGDEDRDDFKKKTQHQQRWREINIFCVTNQDTNAHFNTMNNPTQEAQ